MHYYGIICSASITKKALNDLVMKKIITCLLYFCYLNPISATHIVGGSLTYEHLGGDEYKIKLEVLRDCANGDPNAYFDNPASIGVFNDNGDLVENIWINFTVDDTISIDVPNSVCNYPPQVCIHRAIYEKDIILSPTTGVYTLTYQRCCRSGQLLNLVNPLEKGITLHTTIDHSLQNSSPVFNNDIPFAVFSNTAFSYNGSAHDVDGDSLVYELMNPITGATADFPLPQPPAGPPYDPINFLMPTYAVSNMLGGNYPLQIDPVTGEMSAIPSTIGVFQISYSVKEFRENQLIGTIYRDFTFVVIPQEEGQNYDISGKVLVNESIPLDIGKVQILERDIVTDEFSIYSEQDIGPQGGYSFENIPAGVFYTKAIIDTSSIYHDNYLPTYYKSAAFWYEADAMNQCDTSQAYRDIHLIHVDSLTGLIFLNGTVLNVENSDPVADLNLILLNENDEFVQARTTNAEGVFGFEKLNPGTYKIYADLINSDIFNTEPLLIDLDRSSTATINLHEDFLSIETLTNTTIINQKNSYSLDIYPNPADDNLTMVLESTNASTYSISIFDIYGQKLDAVLEDKFLPGGNNLIEINTAQFPSGVYLLEIVNEGERIAKKVFKK